MQLFGYRPRSSAWLVSGVLGIGLLACAVSSATAGTLSATYFKIDVANGEGSDSWEVLSSDGSVTYDPLTHWWSWSTGMHSFPNTGATLSDAALDVVGDPEEYRSFGLAFSGYAGTSDTTFTITTAILTFDTPLTSATALGSPGITLTRQGGAHTASVVGAGGDSGTFAFASYLNGATESNPPDGSLSYELLPGFTTTSSDTQDDYTGFNAFGSVSSMQLQQKFVLSAGDQISGTTSYVVTPEPVGFVLLAFLGLAACRRRG